MKVLFLSHTPGGGPFVVGSHHLSKALADEGHDVLHVSPPVTPAHLLRMRESFERERVRRWWNGGERLRGVTDVVPASFIPWQLACKSNEAGYIVFGRWCSPSVMSALARHDFMEPDLVLIDEPRFAGFAQKFVGARIVYRPTDLYADMRNDQHVAEAERELVRYAHRFIATSEPVARHLQEMGVTDILLVENGVDINTFSSFVKCDREGGSTGSGRPSVVYIGALDERFGFDSLIQAAEQNPDTPFVVAGPVSALAEGKLKGVQNIELIGAVSFDSLPKLLNRASLAILPLSQHPSNQGRSPMKLFEYAASGLPVVATATDELRRRALGFVALADSPSDFALTVKKVLSGEKSLADGRKDAESHSWQKKAKDILAYAME